MLGMTTGETPEPVMSFSMSELEFRDGLDGAWRLVDAWGLEGSTRRLLGGPSNLDVQIPDDVAACAQIMLAIAEIVRVSIDGAHSLWGLDANPDVPRHVVRQAIQDATYNRAER